MSRVAVNGIIGQRQRRSPGASPMKEANKIGFFFGAGAERCYCLPSGAGYVYDTLCTRKEELYKALEKFYSGRVLEGYAKNYQAEFLFYSNRHAYRRMIELSTRSALGINYDSKETDNKDIVELCFGSKVSSDKHKTYRAIVQKAYDKYRKCRSRDSEVSKVENSIDSILKVLYMLSLNDALKLEEIKDINEFWEINRNLKSDLYYRLFEGVENKKSEKDDVGFEQYDALSKDDKNFIASFVRNNLKYYGVIEQDFSTIINPQRAGPVKFWRLVNYFWSAFFSILKPMLKLSSKYRHLVDDENLNYEELLNTSVDGRPFLIEVLQHLVSDDYLEECTNKVKKKSYYAVLREESKKGNVPIDFVLTTNYTPYVKTLGLEDKKNNKYCYLAGSVFQFEFPYELRTIDVRDNASEIKSSDLVFPYIMTQAPVKPIIESRLIGEYSKAINHLNGCDLLIILGYSLGENDNHINSLLREYITKPGRKMLICHYYNPSDPATCQSIPEEEERESLYKKLRVKKDEVADKIDLLPHDGNAFSLTEDIKKRLYK
ncbi:MAG: hypothetical protein GX878_00440 [Firmicutes bacterium]|nr:hypothetical protein [Bacillota bacterium]